MYVVNTELLKNNNVTKIIQGWFPYKSNGADGQQTPSAQCPGRCTGMKSMS